MTKKERYCNECDGELIAPHGGFIVCKECGLAHDIILDDRPPFKEEDDSLELGEAVYHDAPITTALKPYIPRRLRSSKIGIIIKRYSYVNYDIQKNKQVFVELKKICNRYSMVTHLYNQCCHFYKKTSDDLKFLKSDLLVWIIVYTQCRLYNIPFNLSFFKGMGFSNNKIKIIRKKFFELKDKYNLQIYNAKINKTLWYLLGRYIKEPRLKSVLQKNILKLIVNKYNDKNIFEKKILISAIVYILLKKFKYCKITYKDIAKITHLSVDVIYRYVKTIKEL